MDKQIIEWITQKPEVSYQSAVLDMNSIIMYYYRIGEIIIMLMCTHGVRANGIN